MSVNDQKPLEPVPEKDRPYDQMPMPHRVQSAQEKAWLEYARYEWDSRNLTSVGHLLYWMGR